MAHDHTVRPGEAFIAHPGQHLSENWNQYPLHPASNVNFPGNRAGVLRSSADRIGDTLNLDVSPFSDNQRGHVGYGLLIDRPGRSSPLHGSYALHQNGVKIVGGDALKITGGFGVVDAEQVGQVPRVGDPAGQRGGRGCLR